jgi:hypothetical protein
VAAALENPNLLEMVEECLSPTFDWGPDISEPTFMFGTHTSLWPHGLRSCLLWELGCLVRCRTCAWFLFLGPFHFSFPWTVLVPVTSLSEGKWCNQKVLCCSFHSVVSATAFCGCIPTQINWCLYLFGNGYYFLSFLAQCSSSSSLLYHVFHTFFIKKPWFLLFFRSKTMISSWLWVSLV